MLDKRTERLLNKLNLLCRSGSFCIVDEEDLCDERAGIDKDGVKGILGYLCDRGYLEMQYADDGVWCVRPLPEGRLYSERLKGERNTEAAKRRTVALYSLLGAFVGALVGSFCAFLISLAF